MNREIYLLETNQSEVKIFWMKKRLCDLWIKKDGVIAILFKTAGKRALLKVEGNSDLQVGKTVGKVICQTSQRAVTLYRLCFLMKKRGQ